MSNARVLPCWSGRGWARMTDLQLAVCSEMVFTDLPLVDRVRRIDDLGFAVEIWSWHDKDLDALAATGARFSSMTGYLQGDLIDPASAEEVVRTAELSIKAAETLGVPRLNLHTAELVDGKAARPRHRATGEMWLTAQRALERIGEGSLVELVRRCGDAIGEVQVADVPGRCEPGTGEIHYPAIAKALRDIGFIGTVGLEAYASAGGITGSEAALAAFRRAFA